MPVSVTLSLPETVFSALRREPEDFCQEMRVAAAAKWYEMGQVGQGKAAEIAGLSRHDFLMALARYGVSPFQVGVDELDEELA